MPIEVIIAHAAAEYPAIVVSARPVARHQHDQIKLLLGNFANFSHQQAAQLELIQGASSKTVTDTIELRTTLLLHHQVHKTFLI